MAQTLYDVAIVGFGPSGAVGVTLAELQETEGVLGAWFTRHHCAAALVRPDHYVFGTAATAGDIAALLAEAAAWQH